MAERKIKGLLGGAPFPSQWHSLSVGRGTARTAGNQKAGGLMSLYKLTLAQQSWGGVGGGVGNAHQGPHMHKHTKCHMENKNTSWTHHHLILDKLSCLNRGGSKIIMFQWIFVYWHHLMPYDVAMVTEKNTLLLAFHVKWLQIMISLC